MATITIPNGTASAGGKGQAPLYGRQTTSVCKIVDLVNAAAVKGSAIAQDDVIQAVAIPANSYVKSCFARVIEVADVATLNVDIGTGVDADGFVDGGDATALGLLKPTEFAQGRTGLQHGGTGTVTGAPLNQNGTFNYTATYDTIDVTLMTFTGTVPTTGQIAVFVEYVDLTEPRGANIADIQ